MFGRSTMRRALVAALASASLLAPSFAAAGERAMVPGRICDHQWRQGTWQIRQLIRCAARRWDSPGTPREAVRVARCESHLNPRAYNANGYAGLFQQATRYWPGRAERWGQPDRSVFNARANVIVSIRMAHALGSWSAWGGCG